MRKSGKRRKQEPHVGIFWLVRGKLLIDSSALSGAEGYGDFKIHSRGHAEVWEQFQQRGLVFPEMEYEESPRGRVMFNAKTQQFTLLADICILRDKDLVRTIMAELKLPSHTETKTDEHYRCSRCLQGK
jgi:hypothetical protein